jgi:hypothetical protein
MSNILEFSFGPYTLKMISTTNKDEGSKQLSPLRYKLLLGHLSNALRIITYNEEKQQLTKEYIQALAIALLGCCDLPMSQPKNDEKEKQLSLSVFNRRVNNKPEYLILELKKDPNQQEAIFLSENPEFGQIIKLLSERFNIKQEVKQPNLCIVAASLGIMAIGNLTEEDVSNIIINTLQSHENILKKQIDVRLE